MTERVFPTGSVRDNRDGKGRFDLIPSEPMFQLARHYERGCGHYGERNWERGQHLMSFLDSAERHLTQLKAGMEDENHAIAVVWNLFGYIQTLKWIEDGVLPAELDDRPRRQPCETCTTTGTTSTTTDLGHSLMQVSSSLGWPFLEPLYSQDAVWPTATEDDDD